MIGCRFNKILITAFKGYYKLMEHHNADIDVTLEFYYIGRDDLVGVFDGKHAWIAAASSCISAKGLVEALKQHHSNLVEVKVSRPRIKLIEEGEPKRVRIRIRSDI